MSDTDLELLKRYTRDHAEDAFAEIVRRHLDLVHSAALRQVRSPQLAEEVAQSAFTDLARNATRLTGSGDAPSPESGSDAPSLGSLTPWLYQVTRRTAIDVVRREARRQMREQIATEMNAVNATTADWTHIEPLLDEAMSALDDTDRAAVLLRYFENKSLREVGQTLGTSDDAAQKRVSRAVERLREFFAQRGVTVGAGGLAVVISANAVQAAPVGLVITISTAAALTGTTLATTATITATKAIAMTAIQKIIVTATVAVLAGAGIYEARQAAQLRGQVQTLQQQQAPLVEQNRQLQRERDDATNRLTNLTAENSRLKSNPNELELLKLRGEVGVLRRNSTQTNDPTLQTAMAWLAKKEKLQRAFEEKPDQRVPEMQSFTEEAWLSLVKDLELDTAEQIRFAMHFVRSSAKMNSTPMIQTALKKFMEANNGNWPEDVVQLKPFFDQPIDDAILQRYKILDKEQTQSGWLNGMILIEKEAVNRWSEPQIAIGPTKSGQAGPPAPVHLSFQQELKSVMQSFQTANSEQTPFQKPDDFNKLAPYVTTPEQKAALENMIKTLKDAEAP